MDDLEPQRARQEVLPVLPTDKIALQLRAAEHEKRGSVRALRLVRRAHLRFVIRWRENESKQCNFIVCFEVMKS